MFKVGDRIIFAKIPCMPKKWQNYAGLSSIGTVVVKPDKANHNDLVRYHKKKLIWIKPDDAGYGAGFEGWTFYVFEEDVRTLYEPNDILKELLK